jgi:hypothetical protein
MLPGCLVVRGRVWCGRRETAVSVPSDVVGLLLFVVLLWPGFAYSAVRARRRPERQVTSLRETVSIVAASVSSIVAVGAGFAVLRAAWPRATPDVGRLLFDARPYLRTHYVSVTWWGLGLLLAAVGGAACVAGAQSSEWVRGVRLSRWLASDPDPSTMSAWWVMFTEYDPDEVELHLGCSLDDGSYVSGVLQAYSQLGADVPDRDLVLGPPLAVRPAGATAPTPMDRAGRMAVSARHIVTLTVSYVRAAGSAPCADTATDRGHASPAAPTPGM